MITAVKQLSNAVFMYLYLQYYLFKLNSDTRFMIKEAFKLRADMRELK